MKKSFVSVLALVIAVSAVAGGHQFLVSALNGANQLAVIEDDQGNHIAVEPVSN